MNISVIKYPDIANGPGCRVAVFVSGCPIHCNGCFNKEVWDYNTGQYMDEKLIDHIKDLMSHDYIEGFTLLGGEPMAPLNVEGTAQLIRAIRETFPDKSIWLYSGYTYDELEKRNSSTVDHILDMVDVLVDGPFDEAKKDITLKFRGSSNQRIIDLPKMRKEKHIVLVDDSKFA